MLPMQTINPMSPVPSTSRSIQNNYDDFRVEAARRASFLNSPVSLIDPASFAAAGPYYTGETDIVLCFKCQLVISHWSEGHTPMHIHEAHSPECGFVRNQNCGNVPMKRRGRLGPRTVRKEENLKYHTYESRLGTFATWPNTCINSEELAEAGFYYHGINDMAVCYHCGIGIDNWSPGEDPWNRHAISSPGCCYLNKVRGFDYVSDVTGQDLYETPTEAPIETTIGNDERSHEENETDEMTLVEKIATLEQENQELVDARLCKVCAVREATIAFVPCGHLATCQYCSPTFTKCIICREEVKAVVRIASD